MKKSFVLIVALILLSAVFYGCKGDSTAEPKVIATAENALIAPSGKTRITKEEILARFPMEKHHEFMRRAIANSAKAGIKYKTGHPFGAVIVDKSGTVLSDGINQVLAKHDPTWHAEMDAIRKACALLKSPKLKGCILYSSGAPCPMCLATAYWANLDGIIYGATVADTLKYGGIDDHFIYEELGKPIEDRAISEQIMLQPETVKVWKEYSERKDKVDY